VHTTSLGFIFFLLKCLPHPLLAFLLKILSVFCFGVPGVLTQGFELAKQVLYTRCLLFTLIYELLIF
jgi:hypothetical protein